jgi:hypothetical protein
MHDTSNHQAAFIAYQAALVEAEQMNDPDLTAQANDDRRRQARTQARQALREAIPARPDGPDPRDAVLANLRPTTADDVALMRHERDKVDALLAADRNILAVIDGADEHRLAAIADAAETSERVLASSDPDGARAEILGRVFNRLAALGHDGAVTAQQDAQDRALTTAWADVLEDMADGQEPAYGPRAIIFQQDPDGYAGTLGMRPTVEDSRHLASATRKVQVDAIHENTGTLGAGQDTAPMEAGR